MPERKLRVIQKGIHRTLIYVAMFILGLLMITPLVMMVSASINPRFHYFVFPIPLWPQPANIANYERIFAISQTGRWLFNSFFIATVTIAGRVFICGLAGYAFAWGNFPRRDLIFWTLMTFLMVPIEATIVPMFIIIARLGWANRYEGLIVPYLLYIFGTFLMRQYIITIPRDYQDAARVDGASEFIIFWRVIFPMAKPAVATLVVLSFVEIWNDFLFPLVVTQSAEMRPITVGLATMVTGRGGEAGTITAGATLVVLPTLLVYLFFQRYVVQGMALSGLK
jgi:multiple sugar transport system permease protein